MIQQPHVIAIIPARGGSKRIPGKNLLPFKGKPLLAHSIEDALGSRYVERAVVTTDDPEIQRVAMEFGAEVIERPPELATDAATSESALLHALDELERESGYVPDLVVFLQCTSPARDPEDIDGAVEELMRAKADSLLSVCRFERYLWGVFDGQPRPINYDYQQRWRDQDFPPQFMENGSIYVFRPRVLREFKNRLGGRIALFEMSSDKSFQIDRPEDTESPLLW